KGLFLILLHPFGKCSMVLVSSSLSNPPLVEEPPGVAAVDCRRFSKQQIFPLAGRSNHFLPQQPLLRRREKQRQLVAELGVKRVLPEPLDEGAEGQDVRRFPDGQPFRGLERVEFAGKSPGKPWVRRDDRDA